MLLESIDPIPWLAAEVVGKESRDARGAGKSPEIRHARSDRGRLEALGLCDGPTGHVASVAPAHHRQPVGIGDAIGDQLVDAGLIVFVILATPVIHVRDAELAAVAGGAPRLRPANRPAARPQRRPRIRTYASDKTFRADPRP